MNTTVIIPTTGAPVLKIALETVLTQSKPCKVLLIIDGYKFSSAVSEIVGVVHALDFTRVDIVSLPENVGANGWYGHRVYASIPMLVNTPYVAFLDEDNCFVSDWIETMEAAIQDADVVTCRRTVVKQDGEIIGRDTRESIGRNQYGYTLHDTNTYLFRQSIAHRICPRIYGQWGADRPFTEAVLKENHKHLSNYYGTFYRSPERLYKHFEEVCK